MYTSCIDTHHVLTLPQLCFERAVWDAPYQLVGHLGPVVCARFSPRLYFARGAGGGPNREEAGACVALGGTDGVVSVWLLNNTRAVMAGRKVRVDVEVGVGAEVGVGVEVGVC